MSVLPDHDIALVLGNSAYLGWTELTVECAIDAMSGSFALTLASKENTGAADWPIEEGAPCIVSLGQQILITGHVDLVQRAIDAESRSIHIQGRDRTADLVDCSAIHKPGSWSNRKLEAIAAELVAPFGIELAIEGDTGAPFRRFAIQQGESVFDAIERMARYRGVVAWTSGDGRLRIGNPDSGVRAGSVQEGVNLLSADGTRSVADRYSAYVVKGQASGDDQRSGAAVAQVSGGAQDAAVGRYRPLLVIGEEQADAASLQKRAEWEAAVRAGRAKPATVTVPGWLDSEGNAWRPGKRTACDVPSAQIAGDLLIERVSMRRDAQMGTTTRLDVVPPEAWTQLAEPEPEEAA